MLLHMIIQDLHAMEGTNTFEVISFLSLLQPSEGCKTY